VLPRSVPSQSGWRDSALCLRSWNWPLIIREVGKRPSKRKQLSSFLHTGGNHQPILESTSSPHQFLSTKYKLTRKEEQVIPRSICSHLEPGDEWAQLNEGVGGNSRPRPAVPNNSGAAEHS